MLSNGVSTTDIRRLSDDWNVTERQIDNYIAKANERLLEVGMQDAQLTLGIIVKNLWEIQRDARIDGQIAEARKALMDIAALKGLKQTQINHVVSQGPKRMENASDADLDSILEAEYNIKEDDEDQS